MWVFSTDAELQSETLRKCFDARCLEHREKMGGSESFKNFQTYKNSTMNDDEDDRSTYYYYY